MVILWLAHPFAANASNWARVDYPPIDYQDAYYYSAPKQKTLQSLDELDPEILKTYEKLGIPLREQEMLAGVANVAVDAVTVGVNVAVGTPVVLTNSRVHALEAVRGQLAPEGTGNDLSLPAINLLGAIGVPLIILALILEGMHSMRQRRFGGTNRHLPPSLPATA